jgi:xanthine dehydrogenase small subunit
VTIEGLNSAELTPIQRELVERGASQCGFCTPGIVMALTGFLLSSPEITPGKAVAALDGNICRCTGYVSIKAAAAALADKYGLLSGVTDRVPALVMEGILPSYFADASRRLRSIERRDTADEGRRERVIAGGTDLLVKMPNETERVPAMFLSRERKYKGIRIDGRYCVIGSASTMDEIRADRNMRSILPGIDAYFNLIASAPIRREATIGGNIVNASPIGDLIILFLALDASVVLRSAKKERVVPLRKFYKAYKTLDMQEGELLAELHFPLPAPGFRFHFEKVSRRAHLDIASVNTAIGLGMDGSTIRSALLSAGGVAPVPMLLARASAFLAGKEAEPDVIREAAGIAGEEISPIDDVRGSAAYKRLLLQRLIRAHFIELFPERAMTAELLRT